MPQLGIVADDLTGAMDTGVQLAKRGLSTLVMLGGGGWLPSDAVVISTDSRAQPAAEAYRRAKGAAVVLRGRTVYKKIDSTLRGNLGLELDGLLDGLGLERALVAPTFPATGRTVLDGYHRIHGVLLSETAFACDPIWPMHESHVPTLLAGQTRRKVGHLPLGVVERGEEAVTQALMDVDASIVVADAVEPAHLRTLAHALTRTPEPWLPCGSAGLAEEWVLSLGVGRTETVPFRWSADARPVLVVAGSRNPTSLRQLQWAERDGGLWLVHVALSGAWKEQVQHEALPLLRRGHSVALTTSLAELCPGREVATADLLGQATALVLRHVRLAGLFMTGGDIALATCRALGVTALRILGEVQAGIPAGVLVGGRSESTRVVTKAGGFGDEAAITQSIDFLRGG